MLNSRTIVLRPTPVGFENLMQIVCMHESSDKAMRECAWASLLHLRRQHSSLREAREVAILRQRIDCGPASGGAS